MQMRGKYTFDVFSSGMVESNFVTWTVNGGSKGKGKAEHFHSALYDIQTTLKRSGMDYTV